MAVVTIHEAKTHLSRLLKQVEAGEEITIARGGKKIAKIVALDHAKEPRKPGLLKGKIALSDAFFEPLPEDELAAWEGGVKV